MMSTTNLMLLGFTPEGEERFVVRSLATLREQLITARRTDPVILICRIDLCRLAWKESSVCKFNLT